jgi:endonuclease/exonuclease/phosphatase family metal-dependent hydrolase
MNLITFNTWGGRCGRQPIRDFFEKYKNTDIFCLQEMWQTDNPAMIEAFDQRIVLNLLDEVAACLPDFRIFFRPQYRGIYGLATFVRKNIQVENEGEIFVFKDQGFENPLSLGNHARNIQHINLKTPGGLLTVINFHGLWNGQGKSDTADRIQQSQKIANFMKDIKNPFILAGDFNLTPQSESLKILEDVGLKNLISEYGITSTRSSFYPKPEKYADYILTSKGVHDSDFEVLPDEASDHLGLRITFKVSST